MQYHFREIEARWQKYWAENKTFKADNNSSKPKYYVLDMFPYPSGAGLHVGHPLGYIASDIYARYKRLQGYNVLHPMGYDSFGLPAEQYAIQTGQHPAITTEQNINRYREQMDKIGFSFDWDREVRTSDPGYYKWTQWIFIQLFNSWYNKETDKAQNINSLIAEFQKNGNEKINAVCDEIPVFTAGEWNAKTEKLQQQILLNYRLAYLADSWVNWCPALGTVLANDEVKDGVSERGGHPVEQKYMQQWSMRITAYAERLLNGLEKLDWTESIKDSQRNWIGKSSGSSLRFQLDGHDETIEVFTTRPDTVFGVSFVTLAPEHELVSKITTVQYKEAVEDYIKQAKGRSERDRMSDVKRISGQFTGAFVLHPFTGKKVPVWIGDYVLATYGTGAVMAVPAHDTRDYAFARFFEKELTDILGHSPIVEVIEGGDVSKEAYDPKEGKVINSDFLNGLEVKDAIKKAIEKIEEKGLGKGKINYRLRDAIFGRQRYWGEPIPVYYKDGVPYVLDEKELPLLLPEVDKYLPTETGEPPLARAKDFKYKGEFDYELSTMPGWAGSSWYFLRYMDAHNEKSFASKEAIDYWQDVDLYIGGAEHATGHLLYVRFWTKFLFDMGYIPKDEPAQKLINQGMIQGRSNFVYRIVGENKFVSFNLKDQYQTSTLHVDVNIVNNDILDIDAFRNWREEYKNAEFILEKNSLPIGEGQGGVYVCGSEVEKMSKSKWNVVSPDKICEDYGADCLRLYEMFLGPLEQSKPWITNGIEGVQRFLKKLWRLFYDNEGKLLVVDAPASKAELKTLHKTIKKITDDLDRFSFNTSVSNFMICVNELTDLRCNKKEVLEQLLIILSPYAPHIAEELWKQTGHEQSITYAAFPEFKEEYLIESSFSYPVSVNGKTRFNYELSLSLSPQEIEKEVLSTEELKKYTEGKTIKKVIVVPNKIVNVVVA